MKKRLVLIGGGHAHMVTLANLNKFIDKGHRVTVIGTSVHHYYSGMGPGMLSGTYRPEEIRFATRHVVEKQGGTFILGKATGIDPENKIVRLEKGGTVFYDVLSCNVGSYVPRLPTEAAEGDIFSVKPIKGLMEARHRLVHHFNRHELRVVVVGGGPSSAEVAGNLWQLAQKIRKFFPRITIVAGSAFMSAFPQSVRHRITRLLRRRNITILENAYAKSISTDHVTLEDGETLPADFIFLALGVKPSTIFADSGIATGPDGGMRVNRFLQSTQHPDLFGGGDCIYYQDQPLDKVGVYAVRENPILFHNLSARLNGGQLKAFDPGGDYLLIFNMGGRIGVLKKRWLEFDGRLAFLIKDYIDRKFMIEFQDIE